jgi:hypothetical protein
VVGVPEIDPDEVSMDSPGGSPVADHEVIDAVDEESVAEAARALMAVPDTFDWSPESATATVLVIVQVNDVEPEAPEPSVAVSVTEQVQAVVGVPVIVPVEPSIDSPAGSPVADHASVAVDEVSVAVLWRALMADPETWDWPAGVATETVLVIVQVNDVEPEAPEPSVAVSVTEQVQAEVGVPVIVPVEPSIDRPAGSPVADHASVAVDEESVAESWRALMADPVRWDWLPGFVTDTELVIVQPKVVVPEAPLPSVTVTVTEQVQAVVGVPVMAPPMTSIVSPTGRPVALKARVADGDESVAPMSSWVTGEPEVSTCAPGPVTVMALVTVHENDVEPANPAPSVAVTVTELTPAAVGVPEMVPVELLIDRPAGSPLAVQV